MPKEDSTQFDGPLYESVDKDKKYQEAYQVNFKDAEGQRFYLLINELG